MIRLVCFIKIEIGHTNGVIAALKEIPEVVTIWSITGEYDCIAIIEADTTEALHDVYAKRIDQVPGVAATSSHLVMTTWEK
jgi:DNA-binding Lrp family transcriptional regulator